MSVVCLWKLMEENGCRRDVFGSQWRKMDVTGMSLEVNGGKWISLGCHWMSTDVTRKSVDDNGGQWTFVDVKMLTSRDFQSETFGMSLDVAKATSKTIHKFP